MDRFDPNPATVGSDVGVGRIVDDAAAWAIVTPPTYPVAGVFQTVVIAAKWFRDNLATAVNYTCQQANKDGIYYEIAPADEIVEGIQQRWESLSAVQQAVAVAIGVAIVVAVVAPVIPP